jgi:hypothetical protein
MNTALHVKRRRPVIELEDIEARRQELGIHDDTLREEIAGLSAGDRVRLTMITSPNTIQVVEVTIRSMEGNHYRGILKTQLPAKCPVQVGKRCTITFSATHIHSVISAS